MPRMATSRTVLDISAPIPKIWVVGITLYGTHRRWRQGIGLRSVDEEQRRRQWIKGRYELLAADNLTVDPFLHASVPTDLACMNRFQLLLASSFGG
jgi:hypothetical protein